ncbi:stomatin family protein [Cordyceps militaris CM01]|uniref:Stomatin family protein n=1 Tax=Cordyceps militaris (strain CM01) TaxID=983644 RepID=G3JRD2_CORMM|nr:stomatin family protein [Cordyceps militaris CM01]EGX88482.1 stomatin family protein [Cordyceps militaris CM01]
MSGDFGHPIHPSGDYFYVLGPGLDGTVASRTIAARYDWPPIWTGLNCADTVMATPPNHDTMSSADQILNHGEGTSAKFASSEHGTSANGQGTGGFVRQGRMAVVAPPSEEDLQTSYAKVVGSEANPKGWYGSMINTLGAIIGTMGAVPCCICCPNPYKSVQQGNVGLVTKFGRFYKAVDPGLVKVNPLSEHLLQVDVKIQTADVPEQICMTKDNVTLRLKSVIYYHIVAPHKAAFGISNVRQALMERTQTTLRHVVGARVLQDVIERREEIALSIGEIIEDVAAGWGVQVESMLVKDIIFSQELQESLSMAAQSKRIGESKIIAAKAEVEAAKLMRQAADILSSAPAMQIRYLEAMQAMAKSANSKVIFLPGASSSSMASAAGPLGAIPQDQDGQDGFNQAIQAHVIENI